MDSTVSHKKKERNKDYSLDRVSIEYKQQDMYYIEKKGTGTNTSSKRETKTKSCTDQ